MRFVIGFLIGFAPLAASATVVIGDASFETPQVRNSYRYRPSPNPWAFSENSGVAYAGTFFTGPAPDGSQAAFIQSGGGELGNLPGEITQGLTGLTLGDTYAFSYYAAERPGYSANPIDVSFGGIDLGTATPASASFVLETTSSFVATATSGTLEFLGTQATGDYDSVIDLVTVSDTPPSGQVTLPEPATFALLGFSLIGLSVARRRQMF